MTEKSLDDYLNELSLKAPTRAIFIPQIKTFKNASDKTVNDYIVRNQLAVTDIKFLVDDSNNFITVVIYKL